MQNNFARIFKSTHGGEKMDTYGESALQLSSKSHTNFISLDESNDLSSRLNLMTLNMKLLSVAGIIPSKQICSNFWKYGAYRLCQLLSFVLYGVVFLGEVLALYHCWGDLVTTVDNIAVAATLIIGYIPAIFAILNRNNICSLIEYLETKSIFCMASIRANKTHMKTIRDAQKSATYLTWSTIICLLINIFFWTTYPLVLLMFVKNSSAEQDLSGPQFQYFIFVMWVPFDTNVLHVYICVYLLQAITFTITLTYLIGLLPLYLTFIIYATAHFKIISTSISDIDRSVADETEQEFSKIGPDFVTFQSECGRSNEDVVNVDRKGEFGEPTLERSEFGFRSVKELTANTRSSYPGPRPSVSMLLECVKLHQYAIRFARDVDDVTGRCLFVSACFVTVMLITQTFQMSLVRVSHVIIIALSSTAINVFSQRSMHVTLRLGLFLLSEKWLSEVITTKYCAGFLTCLFQLFILSWFGQGVINESVAVGEAAYNCLWYDRSVEFMRLLLTVLTRAQTPLQITLGKLIPLSLDLFTAVMQTTYKFYTVLLKVHDS